MTSESGDIREQRAEDILPAPVAELEASVSEACASPGEWPAQIAAGVYAGIGFAIENPQLVELLLVDSSDGSGLSGRVVARLTAMVRSKAPAAMRLPGSSDEALVASVVSLVGDHVRLGRLERLAELRPDLVLLTLLPYLGFADAQGWANRTAPA